MFKIKVLFYSAYFVSLAAVSFVLEVISISIFMGGCVDTGTIIGLISGAVDGNLAGNLMKNSMAKQ